MLSQKFADKIERRSNKILVLVKLPYSLVAPREGELVVYGGIEEPSGLGYCSRQLFNQPTGL